MILLYFFAAFIMSWAIARFVRRRAISAYLKEHKGQNNRVRILPDGAGLGIVATWIAMCLLMVSEGYMPLKLCLAMAPGALVSLGFYLRQHKGYPNSFAALLTAVAVGAGMYILGGVDTLVIADFVWQGPVATYVMNVVAFAALFVLVYVFRNFDSVDGKEGNLGAMVIAICVTSIVIGKKNPMFFLIPCVAGFLVHNWHPARYLMGDASATFLGYVIGLFAVYFQNEELCLRNDNIPFTAFLLICLVPLFDVVYTAVRRRLKGADLSKPSKNHLYQRLLYSGFSHTGVILTQMGLCGIMLVLVMIGAYFNSFELDISLLAVALLVMAFYAAWVEIRFPFVSEKQDKKV